MYNKHIIVNRLTASDKRYIDLQLTNFWIDLDKNLCFYSKAPILLLKSLINLTVLHLENMLKQEVVTYNIFIYNDIFKIYNLND